MYTYENSEKKEWVPKTELGKRVKANAVTSIEQIFHEGKRIEENEIVDALIPDLASELIEIKNVQRMTKNNRKAKYRAVVVVGDRKGHVGLGIGKNVEVKEAIENATINAKMNVIPVVFGCGSWQCQCGMPHSLPFIVTGKCASVKVTLKPGPRGLGIVASKTLKTMLDLAGIKDIWTFSTGRTRTRYNMLVAAYRALENVGKIKNSEALRLQHSVSSN